nr:LysR family transcriptional regulator [Phaeacidiphilus oryzae]
MLDVRRLRLLRELSLRGTIAAVAEALSFTPSAVSQQLSTLEREAGVPLLERTGRTVALTPAGENLVRHAEAVLARLEQAAAELADTRRGLSGPLRIGAFPTAARALLPAALSRLARDHPGLEPMVREIDPADVAPALRAGDLGIALVHEYDHVPLPPEPGITTAHLLTEPMYLASAAPSPPRPPLSPRRPPSPPGSPPPPAPSATP